MLIGYARVSTMDQNPQMQTDALEKAGCGRIFIEKLSGSHKERPELEAALDYMREGDTLVVWKLSRLARSIRQIIATVKQLDIGRTTFYRHFPPELISELRQLKWKLDVYFGSGFIKLFTEKGAPILFKEREEGHYLPVTDNGSYTDEIYAIESIFRLVSKNGNSKEYLNNNRGTYRLSRTVDTNSNITQFIRNDDRLTKIIDPVGRMTTFEYNADGFISLVTDPQGNEYGYSYDGDKLSVYTDPMGYDWAYGYDDRARLISRTDPHSSSYQYFYDNFNRVTREIDKEGFEFSYSYDPENRITMVTDRRGLVTRHFYNENNRLQQTLYPDGSEVSYAYDGRNNVVAVRDENGSVSYLN